MVVSVSPATDHRQV
ncbi:extensin [Iris pallida]|uniref:Extensin n=1 Tax=Iris pallida TaxID=29817 RepID=A0AAX6GXD0_IRIPA|nr:extensin [Iris pallida]